MSRMIRLTEEELCAHVGDWYRDWKDKFGEETHPLGFAKEDLKHRLLGMIPVSFVVDKDFPGVPVLDGVWGVPAIGMKMSTTVYGSSLVSTLQPIKDKSCI